MRQTAEGVNQLSDLRGLSFLIWTLALLNAFDGWATFFGLQAGFIGEANPIMRMVYEGLPVSMLIIKTALSIGLVWFGVNIQRITLSENAKRGFMVAAIGSLLLYSWITALHVMWLSASVEF